jgi:hypothetical protein
MVAGVIVLLPITVFAVLARDSWAEHFGQRPLSVLKPSTTPLFVGTT